MCNVCAGMWRILIFIDFHFHVVDLAQLEPAAREHS